MSLLPGAPQSAYIALEAYLGYPDYSHQTVIDYVSPTTLQGIVQAGYPAIVPPNTTDQAGNLASLFPELAYLLFLVVMDATTPGQPFSFTTVAGSGRLSVAASSFFSYMPNGGTPPTLYLTNPNNTEALIQIGIISN